MTVGTMDLPPEGMLLSGVALAGDPARGIETTEGLSLLFTSEGITVKGQDPETERLFAWSGLDAASCHGEVQRSGGRTATPLELTSGGKTIQFLLPRENVSPGQTAYLDQALPAWLARYRGAEEPIAGRVPPVVPTPTVPTPPVVPTPTVPTPTVPTPTVPTPPVVPRSAAVLIDPVTGNLLPEEPLVSQGDLVEGTDSGSASKKAGEVVNAEPSAAIPAPIISDSAPTPPGGISPVEREISAKGPANRRRMIGVVALVVIAIVAVVVFLTTKSNSDTNNAMTAGNSRSTPASIAVDKALATTINLVRNDLPLGWAQTVGSTASVAVASSNAKVVQTPAVTAFALCLGSPTATIGQIFGNTPQIDETVSSISPVFHSPLNPQIEMQSAVNIVKTRADAKADARAFLNPGFVTCFQQFQTASASALAPGTTARVEQVKITPLAGGVAYGFLTTFTIPSQGIRIVGDAYMIGGRIEAILQPSTHGPAIPSDAFNAAYTAMIGRISANAGN